MKMELQKSESQRLESKVQTTSAYCKSLEQDLQEARQQHQNLNNELNQGQSENLKAVGTKNKQEVQILELQS
jgi:outer membrane murein-binding lipoprotein Lpp